MAYSHTLTDDEKRELLRIARATLKEFLSSGRIPPGAPHRASLTAPAAVFVSLHTGDDLRGCIGTGGDATPIYKAIQEMTIAAASRDPRFSPIEPSEVAKVVIEVSVLGEKTRVSGAAEIAVGTHGVIVAAHGRRGLLLPSVAVENGWDAAKLLAKTCEKAGLAADAWREDGAVIEVFATQTFDEIKLPAVPAVAARR
jgi:AmmeMemoRadiSam system protein A